MQRIPGRGELVTFEIRGRVRIMTTGDTGSPSRLLGRTDISIYTPSTRYLAARRNAQDLPC